MCVCVCACGRYLSLESLSHLATSNTTREAVKKHQDTVLKALQVYHQACLANTLYMQIYNVHADTSTHCTCTCTCICICMYMTVKSR